MKRIALVILPFIIVGYCYAQKHDYQWIMGYRSNLSNPYYGKFKLDFNTQPLHIDTVRTNMNFDAISVTCSDSSGNLLFYSNGIHIYNKTHQLMENGDKINPGNVWNANQNDGYPSIYSGLAIPAPGKNNNYYLIHLAFEYDPPHYANSPLYYSLIDMNANSGLGKVIAKNEVIDTGDFLLPQAVKHANGRDWWIITGRITTGLQYVYLVDAAGVHAPLEQNFGPVPAYPPEGSLCFISPDGNTYTRGQMHDGIRIFDFNRCTGELGNLRFIPKNTNVYGSVFSPDSRFEYFQNQRFVSQIDLFQLDTAAYIDTIAFADYWPDYTPPFYTFTGFPQMGPDHKVYMNSLNTTANMHIMHNPDLPGGACDLQLHGLILPRVYAATTFNLPNYRLGAWENSPCDTLGLMIDDDAFERTIYDAARWSVEKQRQRRTVRLFPTEESGKNRQEEDWQHDPLNPMNYARWRMEAKLRENSGNTHTIAPAIKDTEKH